MSNIQYIKQNQHHFLFDGDKLSNIDLSFFSADHWQAQGALTGSASGRGTTHFFQYQQQQWVLRHYKRGGLMGKCLNDQYLYLGLSRTRAWQEFHLLQYMQTQNLATPAPIAAHVHQSLGYYTCDIITERIPNAQDAFQHLCQSELTAERWQTIGKEIAKLHAAQIYHHDLNIHNLMLDAQNKVWIIDFDKCRQRSGNNWKQQNLHRLYRSLQKEQQRQTTFHWQLNSWDHLLAGYRSQSPTSDN